MNIPTIPQRKEVHAVSYIGLHSSEQIEEKLWEVSTCYASLLKKCLVEVTYEAYGNVTTFVVLYR